MDDYHVFQLAIKEISISIAVRHAADGEILFEKLKEAIPDLLFLDIEMPCKDGISCLLEIRKHPQYHRMPVIIYTGHSHSSYISKTYENGANFFMLKPNTLPALVRKLRQVISMKWKEQLYFPEYDEYVMRS